MININLICVGKLKEKYWNLACNEYIKRLSAFCKFSIIEVDEYKISNKYNDADIKNVIKEEGKRILTKIPNNMYVISLCIEGQALSSTELSQYIFNLTISGVSSITFVIGGSWGLSKDVKDVSSLKLSMSKMTFPHQLARVMLCEQIYRVFQILNVGKYHK